MITSTDQIRGVRDDIVQMADFVVTTSGRVLKSRSGDTPRILVIADDGKVSAQAKAAFEAIMRRVNFQTDVMVAVDALENVIEKWNDEDDDDYVWTQAEWQTLNAVLTDLHRIATNSTVTGGR